MRLYSGMNSSMNEICAGYGDAELEVLADFLRAPWTQDEARPTS